MKKVIFAALSLMAFSAGSFGATDRSPVTENKNVTVVEARSAVDGKSEISEKLLEECIVSLPGMNDLEAEVTSHAGYLKEINGDPNRNEFAKSYKAVIEINYMVHQQSLVIVTTSSVQGQEPVMKVLEKNIKQSKKVRIQPDRGRNLRRPFGPVLLLPDRRSRDRRRQKTRGDLAQAAGRGGMHQDAK